MSESNLERRIEGHYIVPREDFLELQQVAYDQPTPTAGERFGSVMQTTAVFAGLAGAITACSWGIAKATDWYEERRSQRERAAKQFDLDNDPARQQ